jgi:hypothetical protein
MPVEQGPFEQIVNVQWESGLAVEFGEAATDAPKPPIVAGGVGVNEFFEDA